MPTMSDVSIVNWNRTEAKPVASGLERTICSKSLCGSKTLDVHHRTVSQGRKFEVQAGNDYHLVYVIEAPKGGVDELGAAAKLHGLRQSGGDLRDLSFDTISGAGPNGAIVQPHALSLGSMRLLRVRRSLSLF